MNYTPDELRALGIQFGNNVTIHRSVQFFNPDKVRVGSHVRIDCFTLISAREPVVIGNHVHLAAGVYIFGAEGVEIADFAGLSNRVTLLTASDDFVDGFLTGPTIPDRFRQLTRGRVLLGPHALIGASSIIMPGVTVGRGAAVGAMTFVRKNVSEYAIVHGNPARVIGRRDASRLEALEREFLASKRSEPNC